MTRLKLLKRSESRLIRLHLSDAHQLLPVRDQRAYWLSLLVLLTQMSVLRT
jgi:hypothetical protein